MNSEDNILLNSDIESNNTLENKNTDLDIYLKFLLIFIMLYFFAPIIFIEFYYGFTNMNELKSLTIYLYNFCYGCIFSLFIIVSLISIIVTNNIKKCLIFLSVFFFIIISVFNIIVMIYILVCKI